MTPAGETARSTRARIASLLCVFLECAPAHAGTERGTTEDRVAILEVGVMGERELSERSSHLGPAIGIEVEPIENVLELEFGMSIYGNRGAANREFDLAFKRPYRLSDAFEIMPGIGPTWTHTTQAKQRGDAWGAEIVMDLFRWSTPHLGWYLEPSFGMSFGASNNKSVALTAGIFFAVP